MLELTFTSCRPLREDLALMGGTIDDEDFTSIILGSIPQSYDTYIAAITATSTLLNQTLSPTNLIDAICDEVDRRIIKNPKSKKKDEFDAAYVAGQSSGKGKKDGEESKKYKKVKCYNCKKLGHIARECWAKGGGAEGKGPKGKGKGKEVAAKADEKDGNDSDAVWMVSAGDEIIDEVGDKVAVWLQSINEGSGSECYLWTEDEISGNDDIDVVNHSPAITDTESNISTGDLNINDLISDTLTSESEVNLISDLEIVRNSSEDGILKADEEVSEGTLDLDEEPRTSTFAAAVFASSVSQTTETELFDSGASRHMLPYKQKFINYFPIQK